MCLASDRLVRIHTQHQNNCLFCCAVNYIASMRMPLCYGNDFECQSSLGWVYCIKYSTVCFFFSLLDVFFDMRWVFFIDFSHEKRTRENERENGCQYELERERKKDRENTEREREKNIKKDREKERIVKKQSALKLKPRKSNFLLLSIEI